MDIGYKINCDKRLGRAGGVAGIDSYRMDTGLFDSSFLDLVIHLKIVVLAVFRFL